MESRLGRGLDSLITRTVQPTGESNAQEVSLADIRVNPRQPRRVINDAGLEGLAVSIQNHGVLQPIVVRVVDGGYELIAGERRFRASRIAGKSSIPATVVNAEGVRSLELALIENIQREDLSALDEALAYQQLVLSTGVTHQELAERVGKSRTAITNSLRLLELPDEIRDLMGSGQLSAGLARALLGAADPDTMRKIAEEAVEGRFSVRQVEELVRGDKPKAVRRARGSKRRPGRKEEAGPGAGVLSNRAHYEDELRLRFGTKVRVHEAGGRGEIRFEFYSDADRDRLLHLLMTAGDRLDD